MAKEISSLETLELERFVFRVLIERNTSPYKSFLNQFDIGFNILSTESCIHFESN